MNAQTEMTKVMDKIRKLQAMSSSANENEAAAFAEKVQELLAEYNLSLADIPDNDDSVDESIVIDAEEITIALPWRRPLAMAVAKMYFCEYFYTSLSGQRDRHSFVGAAHNVAVTKVMFRYLNGTIDQLAKVAALSHPPKMRSPYRTTFRGMCTQRVCERIYDRIEASKRGEAKTEGGTNLPALLNLYDSWQDKNTAKIEKSVGKLLVKKSKMAVLHGDAIEDGRRAGDSIGLDQQVSNDQTARISK